MPDDETIKDPVSQGPEKDDSSLSMLRRDLYAREESDVIIDRNKAVSDTRARKILESAPVAGGAGSDLKLSDEMGERSQKRRTRLKIAGIVGAFLLVFIGAVWVTLVYRQSRELTVDQIGVEIVAQNEITSGEEITYAIRYTNNSNIGWSRVLLTFEPPAGFTLLDSPEGMRAEGRSLVYEDANLASGDARTVELTGLLVGELQSTALAQVRVAVSPENFPTGEFTQTSTVASVFRLAPVEVSIEASGEAGAGDRVLAIIRIKNTSSQALTGLSLMLDAPPGVQLAPDDEQFSSGFSVTNSRWDLPEVPVFDEVVRNVVFYVQGEAGERRVLGVKAFIQRDDTQYLQRELTHIVSIASSELALDQVYGGSNEDRVVKSGEKLEGSILFKNSGTTELTNVVVRALFEGVGFDEKSLQLKNGAYDPVSRTITWTSATVPALARVLPGTGGEISYGFDILTTEELGQIGDVKANNSLVITATADSPDLPKPVGQEARIAQDRTVLSVQTDLTLVVDAFYDDGRLGITSQGPVPPKVGQQTTYTVRFRIGSTLNDAGDVRLIGVLPDGVSYTGQNYLTVGTLEYNERNGEIAWSIPLLPGLTGITTPPAELDVQVAITPGANSVGKTIDFLNKGVVSAVDQYTDTSVETSITKYPSTETASPQTGRVEN